MTNKQPLFFLSVTLVMIVPTITSTIMTTASAQTTTTSNTTTNTSSPTDLRNRAYGPQFNSPQTYDANVTATINSTAVEGIQSMREFLNMLKPEIERYNLSSTFNDVVMSFAYIQGNVSALEEWTTNITDAAVQQVIQARANSTASQTALESARAELEAARASSASATEEEDDEGDAGAGDEDGGNGEDTVSEPVEPEPETPEPIPTPQSNAEILEELVRNSNSEGSSGTSNNENSNNDGPRLDPEGDGGFPGDIDG